MDSKLEKRKTSRAPWLEYNEGLYFVTVCTKGHKHYLGKIRAGEMELSEIGAFLAMEFENASLHHSNVRILQSVVMPNHFHIIVKIIEERYDVSDSKASAYSGRTLHAASLQVPRG